MVTSKHHLEDGATLSDKKLTEFMAQADGACTAALYMTAVGISLRLKIGFPE